MSTIHIKREYHNFLWPRAFKIYLNHKKIGKVYIDEPFKFDTAPGKYQVQIKIDWYYSNFYEIDIKEGKEYYLLVKFRLNTKSVFTQYFELFRFRNLVLDEITEQEFHTTASTPDFQAVPKDHPIITAVRIIEGITGIIFLLIALFYHRIDPQFFESDNQIFFFIAGIGSLSAAFTYNFTNKWTIDSLKVRWYTGISAYIFLAFLASEYIELAITLLLLGSIYAAITIRGLKKFEAIFR